MSSALVLFALLAVSSFAQSLLQPRPGNQPSAGGSLPWESESGVPQRDVRAALLEATRQRELHEDARRAWSDAFARDGWRSTRASIIAYHEAPGSQLRMVNIRVFAGLLYDKPGSKEVLAVNLIGDEAEVEKTLQECADGEASQRSVNFVYHAALVHHRIADGRFEEAAEVIRSLDYWKQDELREAVQVVKRLSEDVDDFNAWLELIPTLNRLPTFERMRLAQLDLLWRLYDRVSGAGLPLIEEHDLRAKTLAQIALFHGADWMIHGRAAAGAERLWSSVATLASKSDSELRETAWSQVVRARGESVGPRISFWGPVTTSRYVGRGFVAVQLGSALADANHHKESISLLMTTFEGDVEEDLFDTRSRAARHISRSYEALGHYAAALEWFDIATVTYPEWRICGNGAGIKAWAEEQDRSRLKALVDGG